MKIIFIEWKYFLPVYQNENIFYQMGIYIFYQIKIFYQTKIYFYKMKIIIQCKYYIFIE